MPITFGADGFINSASLAAVSIWSGLLSVGLLWRSTRSQREIDTIIKGAMPVVGEDFFRSMARYLAGKFKVRYVFVGSLADDERSIETIAFWQGNDFTRNITYTLKDTPCEKALFKDECFYPRDVAQRFPKDKLLIEMGIEGYLGVPIRGANGCPLGLVVIMDTKPMRKVPLAESVLNVFAERVLAELKRRRAEKEKDKLIAELREANARIGKMKRLLPICAACMKIRDDRGGWQRFEEYIKEQSGVDFSHGICPECQVKLYGIEAERLDEK